MRSGTLSLRAHRSARLAATLFASLALAATVYAGAGPLPAAAPQFDNPAPSPDGGRIALTDATRDGLYIYDVAAGTLAQVAGSPSGGYAYNWSADGTRIGFKQLIPAGEGAHPLHQPVCYDLTAQQLIPLHTPVARAGIPSFSSDGHIAFTIDTQLWVTDAAGGAPKTYDLGNYANLAPISPDGTKVAFNSADDQIWIIDLASGQKRQLTDGGAAYYNPVWSPDSARLAVNTVGGQLVTIDLADGKVYSLGKGTTPSWAPDSATLFYNRVERVDGIRVVNAGIYQARFDGTAAGRLSGAPEPATSARIAAGGDKIAFVSLADGGLYQAPLNTARARAAGAETSAAYTLGNVARIDTSAVSTQKPATAAARAAAPVAAAAEPIEQGQVVVTKAMPYIHQVYDTPDDFNGNWACNATAATMAITYYDKLAYWDCTASTPYVHTSHYGRYISQIYTYNGHTYNIGSADASGRTAYGGYGYIVRNDWLDTKGYMRDYFINHGISSAVDWSPTWAELQAEINAQHPFVMLVDITSSGHYITCKGYFDNQHTMVFNDPYGNKNSGYMNYNGAGACYDWPGYNNGYANLVGVECFIYARADLPVSWAATFSNQSYPTSMTAGTTATAWAEFTNTGTAHWAHSQTYLGTSSPQDRTSPFCNTPNWPSCTRTTDVDQSDVANGQVGRFTFILKAPTTPGTYTEKFKLVREGVTWFGPEITWTITVNASQGGVTGTVRNASTSAAIPGATVTLSGIGNTTTDGSGVYTFVDVTAGTYTVSVSATGYNGASSSVTVTAGQNATKDFSLTPSDTQAPTTPTGLTANATSATSVALTWTASTDNVGVTGYDVRRNGTIIGSSATASYTDTGATPASTFTYDVRAKDAVPNYSGWSATASATTPPSPPVTTNIFTDGFNGSLSYWTPGASGYTYSTAVNHGTYTGPGAAYMPAAGTSQMFRTLGKPFAQGRVWGYFYDGKGGWKAGVCGNAYRQCLSVRDPDGAAHAYIDNEFYSASDNSKYFWRTVGTGGVTHTAYATRNPSTSCAAAWIYFETAVTPGAPGASPTGSFVAKVTDGAGTTTTTQSLTSDFFSWGMGRVHLGLGVGSTNEGYWDDIGFEAKAPDWPVMGTPTGITASSITWAFSPRDNNLFGYDLADAGGAVLSPNYPAAGWIDRADTAWTETGLTANTQYTRKVRGWNGTLNGAWSLTASPWTLAVAPTAGSVTPDNAWVCAGDSVTWTAVGGFGAGKVQYYKYAWDQSPTHTFSGSEPNWSSGTLTTTTTAESTWYLHVQGYNGANVASGSYDYSVTTSSGLSITQQPASQAVCPGATAQFSVVATSSDTLAYQWQKDGASLGDGGSVSGASTSVLTITSATADEAGTYACVISSSCGSTTSDAATLALQAETVITQQPDSQAVCRGRPATLTVVATGEAPLSYQWQKDGVDVSGATAAELTIPAVADADGGTYRCVVTGACGSVTSSEVLLMVTSNAADFNGSCAVDAGDLDIFRFCATGPTVGYDPFNLPSGCDVEPDAEWIIPPDFDRDGDVDMDDFGTFQAEYGMH